MRLRDFGERKSTLLACLRQSGRARSDRWIWKWAENKDSLLLRRLREFRVRYALVAERLAALAEIGVDHLLGDGKLRWHLISRSLAEAFQASMPCAPDSRVTATSHRFATKQTPSITRCKCQLRAPSAT